MASLSSGSVLLSPGFGKGNHKKYSLCLSESHNGDTGQLSTDITLEGSPRGRFSIMESQQGSLAEGGVSVSRLTVKEKLSSSLVQGPVRGSSKRDPSVKHRTGMLGRESRWKIWLFLCVLLMLELNSDE